jgi:glutamate N-acetyltransferase / amino-acid N-acetyltransferase
MSSTHLEFASESEHRAWLESQSSLPRGFQVGTARMDFVPEEAPKPSRMALTLIALDRPSSAFGALFTRNAFPGAPVLVGRRRLEGPTLGAMLINNKVSNVCAPGGVEASERLCAEVARLLDFTPEQILPSSTGVIGWKLPVDAMLGALPEAVGALQSKSVLPAAEGICTTDLYPKVRAAELGGGRIVGIAKGAGMIEPNLATMLVYLLTDLDLPRDVLRTALHEACAQSFNLISIDSDTSTSDTVAMVSSAQVPCPDHDAFKAALVKVCRDLAEDIVRNGEGVHHVLRVRVSGAPDARLARGVGKSIVNSPLLQCAVAGNDPNVGRLVAAIGKYLGAEGVAVDPVRVRLAFGETTVFENGAFRLDRGAEDALVRHFRQAEMYHSVPPADGLTFRPPIKFPPHERCVEVAVELGLGDASTEVLGADRTHEYISENADYRS